MDKKLNRKFFQQDTKEVAQKLLGKFIVRKIGKKIIAAKIIETEAYHGFDDLASHASRGKTQRNQIMFGEAGFIYVYLVYGRHYMFNVVCGAKDFPAAVLIRAVEIDNLIECQTNGPAKLTKRLLIDKKFNNQDIVENKNIWLEDRGLKISKKNIKKAKRIGVDYAGHSANWLWRFHL